MVPLSGVLSSMDLERVPVPLWVLTVAALALVALVAAIVFTVMNQHNDDLRCPPVQAGECNACSPGGCPE